MANEIQTVTFSAAPQHGYFKLTFESEETGEIAFDNHAAAIQAALEALTTIGSGNVSVTVDGLVVTIEFIGALASIDVSAITVTANTLGRNTVETLSLNGIAVGGSVNAKETAHGSYGVIGYSYDASLAEGVLESYGYPVGLVVSGATNLDLTLTTPADVTLALEDGGSFVNVEAEPLAITYTKTQSYSAVDATPGTVQEGSAATATVQGGILLMGVG